MGQKSKGNEELRLVFIGGRSKDNLFHKLCSESKRWERHGAYSDVHYLVVVHKDDEITIEVSDPGVKWTGAREMAIREADTAIVYYAQHDVATFERLGALPSLFELRKQPCPILLICDVDEVEDDKDEKASMDQPTESEPTSTESNMESCGNGLRIRASMKKMRERLERNEIGIVTPAQGESLCARLGETCKFIRLSTAQWDNPMAYLMEMIVDALERRENERNRSFLCTKSKRSSPSTNKMSKIQSKVCSIQ